jgi:hypothetical protein
MFYSPRLNTSLFVLIKILIKLCYLFSEYSPEYAQIQLYSGGEEKTLTLFY